MCKTKAEKTKYVKTSYIIDGNEYQTSKITLALLAKDAMTRKDKAAGDWLQENYTRPINSVRKEYLERFEVQKAKTEKEKAISSLIGFKWD